MSLIKCPECGKEISNLAKTCPHCGYPISEKLEEAIEYPKPKNPSWTNKWVIKAKDTKKKFLNIFLISLVVPVIPIILCITKYSFTTLLVMLISFLIPLTTLTFWLITVFTSVQIVERDGYKILVYIGMKNILIIEDKIQDTSISRYLYGKLPNNKKITTRIIYPDRAVKISVEK